MDFTSLKSLSNSKCIITSIENPKRCFLETFLVRNFYSSLFSDSNCIIYFAECVKYANFRLGKICPWPGFMAAN